MSGETISATPPVPTEELTKIALDACDAALENVQSYDHGEVGNWSRQIINKVLQSLILATTPNEASESPTPPTPPYRFNVNCTIIQQGMAAPAEGGSSDAAGKRGMHAASGAYWDVRRDGMWTFKYPRAMEKGMDLVLNVVWFGTN